MSDLYETSRCESCGEYPDVDSYPEHEGRIRMLGSLLLPPESDTDVKSPIPRVRKAEPLDRMYGETKTGGFRGIVQSAGFVDGDDFRGHVVEIECEGRLVRDIPESRVVVVHRKVKGNWSDIYAYYPVVDLHGSIDVEEWVDLGKVHNLRLFDAVGDSVC